MADTTLYVAFEAPLHLRDAVDRFVDGVAASPAQCHLNELEALVLPFVSEVLSRFFEGPIEAAALEGRLAKVILGSMKAINRVADSLIGRLLRNTTIEEQRALADYFSQLRRYEGGQMYVAYPLSDAAAERAIFVFREFQQGEGDLTKLLLVMKNINEGAIEHYMDNSVACLSLSRVNRALVSAARATILKAAASALEKGISGMEPPARNAIVHYFDSMLIAFENGQSKQ